MAVERVSKMRGVLPARCLTGQAAEAQGKGSICRKDGSAIAAMEAFVCRTLCPGLVGPRVESPAVSRREERGAAKVKSSAS